MCLLYMSRVFGKDYFNSVMRFINTFSNCYGCVIIIFRLFFKFSTLFRIVSIIMYFPCTLIFKINKYESVIKKKLRLVMGLMIC